MPPWQPDAPELAALNAMIGSSTGVRTSRACTQYRWMWSVCSRRRLAWLVTVWARWLAARAGRPAGSRARGRGCLPDRPRPVAGHERDVVLARDESQPRGRPAVPGKPVAGCRAVVLERLATA